MKIPVNVLFIGGFVAMLDQIRALKAREKGIALVEKTCLSPVSLPKFQHTAELLREWTTTA
jgi:hypothetical protein